MAPPASSSDAALVIAYEGAALAHAQAASALDVDGANTHADEIAAIYSELRRRGREAQRRLLPLLAHANANVRGWAAAHALEFEPTRGEATLSEMAAGPPGEHRLNAEMALAMWRAGSLRFPD